MTLDEFTLQHLRGEKFSNRLTINYFFYQPIPTRIQILGDLAKGKRVIHFGCLDHLPLIDEKIQASKWLHKILTENASQCIGVDIDEKCMNYVKSRYGYDNVILGDIAISPPASLTQQQWDLAILGELLEHIDNPVSYLTDIRKNYEKCLDRIIITVPNALTKVNSKMAAKSSEIINSDHRYWFTPYTIAKVIHQSGMHLEEILFANRIQLSSLELIEKKILSWMNKEPSYPMNYASTIIAIASLKKDS